MKSIIVTLASRTYTVESLKFKAERAWREKYDAPIRNLLDALSGLKDVSAKQYGTTGDFLKEVGGILLAQAGELVGAMLNSPDTMLDAICDYSPTFAADRAWIEENSYQDEIAKAFIEVLQIAFPFGQLFQLARNLGSQEKLTSPNSPSPSGESGKTN